MICNVCLFYSMICLPQFQSNYQVNSNRELFNSTEFSNQTVNSYGIIMFGFIDVKAYYLPNIKFVREINNNINNDIGNVNISLSKSVDHINKDKDSYSQEDNLDLFINSLSKDLNKQIQNDYDFALNNIDNKKTNNLLSIIK